MDELIMKIKNKIRGLIIGVGNIEDSIAKEDLQQEILDIYDDIRDLEIIVTATPNPAPSQGGQLDTDPGDGVIREEIIKVRRRLNLWKRRQNQINSKILNLFISLSEDDSPTDVTEPMLRKAYTTTYDNRQEFFTNYSQMKNISPNNHGKIFDVQGGIIKIWEPVCEAVEDYKRDVFGD